MDLPRRSIWSSRSTSRAANAQSFSISIRSSTHNNQENINGWSNDTTTHEQEDVNRSRSSTWYCFWCCIIGAFLAGIALAIILAFWLTSSAAKAATFQEWVMITSSTVSTTSTTTITTATTTTTTTVTTTITTATTTTTTAVTTTITTTTTTVTTTVSTVLPTCASSFVGSVGVLYSTTSGSQTSYICHAYTWTSSVTGLVTLAFQLRHDPDYWYLDDVSITDGYTQLLSNGGFETGSMSPWIRTLPNGNCNSSLAQVVHVPQVHTGTYCISDGSNGCADEISQHFTVIMGQNYTLSFWLKSGAVGSGISALVLIS